jgi:FkbM family methyltransferase
VAFDVGANAGMTALRYARWWPGATIHAFEPFPTAYAQLRDAVAGLPDVTPVNMALGAEPGQVEATDGPVTRGNSLRVADGPVVTVEVTTLDAYCAAHGIGPIDLLKIDTEGYELDVLRGGANTLPRTRAVLAETVFERDERHTHFADLLAALEPHGFRFAHLVDARVNRRGWEYGDALFVRP